MNYTVRLLEDTVLKHYFIGTVFQTSEGGMVHGFGLETFNSKEAGFIAELEIFRKDQGVYFLLVHN